MTRKIIELQLKKSRISTNHILHFFLTLLTSGLWAIVWIVATFYNQGKIKAIDRELLELEICSECNS